MQESQERVSPISRPPHSGSSRRSPRLLVLALTAGCALAGGGVGAGTTAFATSAAPMAASRGGAPAQPGASQPPGAHALSPPSAALTPGSSPTDGGLGPAGIVNPPSEAWTVAGAPGADVLYADACAGPDECWAVGTQADTNGSLILENTGGGWGTVSSPNAGDDANNDLYGVTCVSAGDCWAVGDYQPAGDVVRPLIEWYDGSTWSIVASPDMDTGTWLYGVACAGSGECWAVGQYVNTSIDEYQPLILGYNGSAWSVALQSSGNDLDAVTCVSASDCWAVGDEYDTADQFQTLVEQYGGSGWSTVSSPDAGSDLVYNSLTSVTCTAAINCWAVGISEIPGYDNQSLILQYGGSSWSVVSSVDLGYADDLFGVACAGAADCWAVGTYFPSQSTHLTLIEQFAGTSWSVASSPDPDSADDNLEGVTCDGSVNCWAVGYDGTGGGYSTLVEQWTLGNAPPMVTYLTPAAGPVGGGQRVTVSGYDFPTDGSMTATLGGVSVTPADVTPTSFSFTTPAASAGHVTLQATDADGSSLQDGNAGYVYVALTSYHPLTPFRVLDTRSASCIQCGTGGLLPAGTMTLQVTGYTDPASGESVPSSATAVVLNVIAVAASADSYITVYPTGTGRPLASNLNFGGSNTANLVVVALGAGGALDLYNSLGGVSVVADVEGYFTAPSGTQGEFHPISPLRVCDTRKAETANPCNDEGTQDLALGPGQAEAVNVTAVTGTGGSIPSNGTAEAAVVNLTAVAGTASTYLSVYPTNSSGLCNAPDQVPPSTSSLNVYAATNQANRVIVPLGPAGSGGPNTDVCVYNSQGTVDFILDANGWFGSAAAAAGTKFQAIGPSRICDTRAGTGTECSGATLTAGDTLPVQVSGSGGVPASGPVAVVANLTAVAGTSFTYFTLFPAGGATPNASDLNVFGSENLPNLAIVSLSSSGAVDLYNSLGTIDAILDVEGWFQ